uniref:hypothetical protein n=1 Tax=Acetatifactor sp. TaxID=1872090 RepID=UPI0040573BED
MVSAVTNVSSEEIVGTLGGVGGKLIYPVIQGTIGSQDPSLTMLIMSAISLGLDYVPESSLKAMGDSLGINGLETISDYSFGLIDYNAFKIFCLVWFLIARLSKSNRISYVFGLRFEYFESKIGVFMNWLVIASQNLANIPLSTAAQAAPVTSQQTEVVKYGFSALMCFVLLMIVPIIYLFVRCLFFFLDILLLPVCTFIPFSAIGFEVIKTISVLGLIYTAFANPYLFGVIFGIILLIAIRLFKTAYITIRYFKNIYVKPFFKRFRGYDSDIPLVTPKIPGKVRRYVENADIDIMLPVYILKKVSGMKYVKRHDRWWFISSKDKQYICKPHFWKDTCYCIELKNTADKKMFIKKSLPFFEIFNLKGNEEEISKVFRKVHKKMRFVFSKEYYYRFEEIKELTKFTDYAEYRKQIKNNNKLTREEKRLARLEAKEERRLIRQ